VVAPRIIYPKSSDPRWIQIACLAIFLALYVSFAPTFHRGPGQIAASFAGCLGLDLILLFLRRIPLVPLSGLMTALWTLILIDSTTLWVYVLAGGLAALSKHFIRVEGQHLFVPNNFGTVAALLLFPGQAALTADPWTGPTAGLLAAASIGLVAARKDAYKPQRPDRLRLRDRTLRRAPAPSRSGFPAVPRPLSSHVLPSGVSAALRPWVRRPLMAPGIRSRASRARVFSRPLHEREALGRNAPPCGYGVAG
jgi:hypothetical protein